jgi:SAM-dependent methyltransferase
MLDAAAVGTGTRVLDAGCGAGGASVLAAGRGAHVNGLDAAEALLAIARARVPDADFRAGDLDALPYADGAFDAVIAADVLPYVADPVVTLRELRRVCAPGGRVVLAIWGAPEECEQHAIVAAVREVLLRPLDAEPFALSAPGVLDALVAAAGLLVLGSGITPRRALAPGPCAAGGRSDPPHPGPCAQGGCQRQRREGSLRNRHTGETAGSIKGFPRDWVARRPCHGPPRV